MNNKRGTLKKLLTPYIILGEVTWNMEVSEKIFLVEFLDLLVSMKNY